MHFICMDWRHMGELLAAGREVYAELKNVCVWAKDNAGMGSSVPQPARDWCSCSSTGASAHRNNVQLGQYGRNRTNVWHYPCANSFSPLGRGRQSARAAPDGEAVALVADAIMDCSARGDIVLDAFLGSGTTRDRRGAHRAALLRARARSAIRRYHHAALAGVHRRARASRY